VPGPSPPTLPAQLASHCLARGLLEPGQAVLVAVSGGADSTALADLLHGARAFGLPLKLCLAHLDHGWRGPEEAQADLRVVEGLSGRLDLPLLALSAPSPPIARTEDAARRYRYRQLGRLAQQADCPTIATAHHAGDQAETLLMRLLRGSGLVGLAAIPAERPLYPGTLRVVRPLLEIEPEALRRWLGDRHIPWHEDATNQDLSRDRAAVRARLAGRAARGHAQTLAALAGRLRRRLDEREAALQRQVARHFVHHRLAGCVEMPRVLLAAERGESLALLLRQAGALLRAEGDGPWFTRRHVERFEGLLEREGGLDLPRGLHLHVRGRRAWLVWQDRPSAALPRWSHTAQAAEAFDLQAYLAVQTTGCAALDADRLGERPRLRLLRREDCFTPFGRSGSRAVRIHPWLSKRGVPRFARRGQLVLEGDAGIAWVVGRRVDRTHAVGPKTRRVALLEVEGST